MLFSGYAPSTAKTSYPTLAGREVGWDLQGNAFMFLTDCTMPMAINLILKWEQIGVA
jgi:hypothetical protein